MIHLPKLEATAPERWNSAEGAGSSRTPSVTATTSGVGAPGESADSAITESFAALLSVSVKEADRTDTDGHRDPSDHGESAGAPAVKPTRDEENPARAASAAPVETEGAPSEERLTNTDGLVVLTPGHSSTGHTVAPPTSGRHREEPKATDPTSTATTALALSTMAAPAQPLAPPHPHGGEGASHTGKASPSAPVSGIGPAHRALPPSTSGGTSRAATSSAAEATTAMKAALTERSPFEEAGSRSARGEVPGSATSATATHSAAALATAGHQPSSAATRETGAGSGTSTGPLAEHRAEAATEGSANHGTNSGTEQPSGRAPDSPDASATTGPVSGTITAPAATPAAAIRPETAAQAAQHGEHTLPGVASQLLTVLSPLRSNPSGEHTVTVALHPAELGEVRATLTLSDGQLVVRLAPSSPEASAALRASLGELRAGLETSSPGATVLLADAQTGGWPGSSPDANGQQPSSQNATGAAAAAGATGPELDGGTTAAVPLEDPTSIIDVRL